MEFLNDKRKKQQFLFSYVTFMLNGMLALSVGSLLPFIRDARGLEYTFCGFLVSLHSVGNLISSFFAGALAVKIGRKSSILLFNACYALSYLLILLGGNGGWLVAAFLLTGMARGATSNFSNVTINNLAPGQAWILNGLHAMFSIGAFLFPILLTVLTADFADRWQMACGFMLVMGILSWILYSVMPVDEVRKPQKMGKEYRNKAGGSGEEKKGEDRNAGDGNTRNRNVGDGNTKNRNIRNGNTGDRKAGDESGKNGTEENGKERTGNREGQGLMSFWKEPMFFLCTATLFFYLCVEQGVIGWLVTYFKDTGLLNASLSQVMASVQWVMILAGRLTTANLSTRLDKTKLLRVMGVGLILFFVVLITGRTTPQIVIGIMGFGYSMAGIYPTTVSFAGKLIQKYPLSWSFMLTMASFGSILMPSVIGRIAESEGIFYGMSSIVVVIVIDMALIIGLTSYMKRRGTD